MVASIEDLMGSQSTFKLVQIRLDCRVTHCGVKIEPYRELVKADSN